MIQLGLKTGCLFSMMISALLCGAEPQKQYAPPSPVAAYYFTGCFVRVESLRGGAFPEEQGPVERKTFVMKNAEASAEIVVTHEAALSSKSMSDYVDDSFSDEKRKAAGVETSKIKKTLSESEARVEIDELIVDNVKFHVYQRIFKTSDGFAVVSARAEARKWAEVEDELLRCVNASRLIRDDEMKIIGDRRGVVGIDVDGDVFEKDSVHVGLVDVSGCPVRTHDREYFLNKEKNKPVELLPAKPAADAQEKKVENLPDGRIHRFFGMEINDLLVNYDHARKQKDGSYKIVRTMSLSKPFTICKHVSCYYTPAERRLYKITLASSSFLNPDEKKLRKRMAEMSDAIGERFNDELTMESRPFGHVANFKKDIGQSLAVNLRRESGSANKKYIVITFIDKVVEKGIEQ